MNAGILGLTGGAQAAQDPIIAAFGRPVGVGEALPSLIGGWNFTAAERAASRIAGAAKIGQALFSTSSTGVMSGPVALTKYAQRSAVRATTSGGDPGLSIFDPVASPGVLGFNMDARGTSGDNSHRRAFASNGAGVMVACGNASGATRCMRSTDGGKTWAGSASGMTGAVSSVDFANGLFFAFVDNQSAFYTSPDGVTWTSRAGPWGTSARVRCVVWTGAHYVFGVDDEAAPTLTPTVWRMTSAWANASTTTPSLGSAGSEARGVCAVGYDSTQNLLLGLTRQASSTNTRYVTSSDGGATWALGPAGPINVAASSIIGGGGAFLIVTGQNGSTSRTVWATTNGASFTQLASNSFVAELGFVPGVGHLFASVASGNSTFRPVIWVADSTLTRRPLSSWYGLSNDSATVAGFGYASAAGEVLFAWGETSSSTLFATNSLTLKALHSVPVGTRID